MTELKPCPFCGSEDVSILSFGINALWNGYCNNCGINTGFHSSKKMAITVWNARPRKVDIRPEGGSEMKKEEQEEKVEKENKCTVTLNENFIKKVIADFLRNRGLNVANNNLVELFLEDDVTMEIRAVVEVL